MAQEGIQGAQVVVSCPACGSPGHEFEFDSAEVDSEVLMACDECGGRIAVSINVFVQQRPTGGWK